MYQMLTMWLYIRERLVFSEEVDDPATVVPVSSTFSLSVSNGTNTGLSRITEVEECSDSDTETQDVDMQEFAVDHLMKADDDTDSTTSLSDDSASGRRQESCCRPPQMEFQISHVLAIGFVNLMLLLFRMESRLRNRFNHCCTPSKWNMIKRKRKNSSFALEVPDVQKQRSDGSDGSDDLEILVNPARDERLSMRRSNLSLVDL
jgi:hypothetical protein